MEETWPISLKDLSDRAIGFPDYTKASTIFQSGSGISSNNQYTISSNGYLLINVTYPGTEEEKWQDIVLYINNQPITIGKKFGESHIYQISNTGILLPIAKGSSIYVNDNICTYEVVFIPMK